MTIEPVSRRSFLAASAAAGVALGAASPSNRLRVGVVGLGIRGRSLLYSFSRVAKEANAEVAAVCDIWSVARGRGADLARKVRGSPAAEFKRLEDLLAAPDIDAIILATPDHQHVKQALMCLAAGKHVYLEKPFANTLEDANTLIDACRKSDRVITLGTQRRSDPRHLGAADFVRTGALGDIVEVDVVQNAYSPFRWRRDEDIKLMKEGDTDWSAFLMGKPARAFDARLHLEWRLFREFCSGIIDQWMTHMIDTVHMIAGGTLPRSVVAHGGTYAWKDHRENGDTVRVSLDYPQGFLASYSCTLANSFGSGSRVIGREAALEYEEAWQVTRLAKKGEKPTTPEPLKPRLGSPGANPDEMHLRNWVDCIRKGDRATACTPEHGYQHAVACIMAARALNSGRRQLFDEKSRSITEG